MTNKLTNLPHLIASLLLVAVVAIDGAAHQRIAAIEKGSQRIVVTK